MGTQTSVGDNNGVVEEPRSAMMRLFCKVRVSSAPHHSHRTIEPNGSCIEQSNKFHGTKLGVFSIKPTKCQFKGIAVFEGQESGERRCVGGACGTGKEGGVGRGRHQHRCALRSLRHRVPGAVCASSCSTAAAIMEGYEVLEKLGSGSFGTIRRVIRKSDKKVLLLLVAVQASAQARVAKPPGGSRFFWVAAVRLGGFRGPACLCEACLVPQHQQPAAARLKMVPALRNMPFHHHHLPPWWCTSTGLAGMS